MRHSPTVREARLRFFLAHDFGEDGGYQDAWSDAVLGPVHYRVPNTPMRLAALRRHDLHHVATGYPADWLGESEISAWELASGFGQQPWGWVITLWGLFLGVLFAPRNMFRAFVRGRRSTNLYSAPFEPAWLEESVETLQERLEVLPQQTDADSAWTEEVSTLARVQDVLWFGAWSLAALAYGAISVGPTAVLAGIAIAQSVECPLAEMGSTQA